MDIVAASVSVCCVVDVTMYERGPLHCIAGEHGHVDENQAHDHSNILAYPYVGTCTDTVLRLETWPS